MKFSARDISVISHCKEDFQFQTFCLIHCGRFWVTKWTLDRRMIVRLLSKYNPFFINANLPARLLYQVNMYHLPIPPMKESTIISASSYWPGMACREWI